MNRITLKTMLRSIKSSIGRFAAIFAISALGVGFLAGISASTPDMVLSGSKYFDDEALADVRILSTMGLDDDDVRAVKKIEGVKDVMPVKSADILYVTPENYTIGVTTIALDHNDYLGNPINRITLAEGRLPENKNECLVENTVSAQKHAEIGDVLTVSPQNDEDLSDDFDVEKLTVVGIAENPFYMAMQREQTTVGNGKIAEIIYVSDECFLTDYYTALYMTVDNAAGNLSMSDEYWDVVDPVTERLDDLAETQKYARHDKVVGEARDKIDEAWDTYHEKEAEADEEFAKAEDKMAQAEIDIADGKKTLAEKKAEAEKEISDGEQELKDAYADLKQAEIDIADGKEEYADGLQKLADAKEDYAEGVQKYEDGLAEYEDGKAEYEDGLAEYNDGKAEYDDGAEELEKARLKLVRTENKLDIMSGRLAEGEAQLDAGQAQLDESVAAAGEAMGIPGLTARALIAMAEQNPAIAQMIGPQFEVIKQTQETIDVQRAEIEAGKAQIEAGRDRLTDGWAQYSEAEIELNNAKRQLLDAWLSLEDGRRGLEEAQEQLADAKAELEDGAQEIKDAEADLEEARLDIIDGEQEIKDGWAEYYDGVQELEDGKREFAEEVAKAEADIAKGEADLAEGKQELADAKAEAEQKLSDAEYDILDAEQKLNDLDDPKWFVLDRSQMITPATFDSNTEKVASIAKVFPVFFFLIAALVCLTTMTRMVEEERGLIGTMKALGYSSAAISSKYMIYAFSASLLGAVTGLMAGFKIFPTVIWNAYGIMYRLPKLYTPFNVGYAIFSSLTIIICTLGATWWVCRQSLVESAASLMLPKAPEPGKRVFLEYITPLWKRMSFNGKVTVRNLFRYKKRFFMTTFGVMGCTALLVTGFGLKDSIDDILHNQFDILWKFDLIVGVKDMDENPLDYRLKALVDDTEGYMPVHQESGKVTHGDSPKSEVSIYVPEDADEFEEDYVLFRTRVKHEPVEFTKGSVILTEKASRTIGADVGDKMRLVNADDDEVEVTISGIVENYIQGYVYLAPDVYEEVYGEKPAFNSLFVRTGGLESDERDKLAQDILKCNSAISAGFTEDTADDFSDTFKSIDMIVGVLIVCAGMLAFVVLYNLTNININERHKEVATLKVLGFYEGEVASYILRETNALSAMGAVVGLFAGKILHGFVARTAEVDMVMFGRIIMPSSYLIAFGLTMVFSLLVSFAMLKKLKSISMVESLKAPE